ncbi:hypothetical protein L9F63_027423, partial [Diploptera punctata]
MATYRCLGALSRISNNKAFILRCKKYKPSLEQAAKGPVQHFQSKVIDNVCVITFDTPGAKVNTLDESVMNEVERVIKRIEADPNVQAAVLISGKPGCFIAGADVGMLSSLKSAKEVETSGLEVALACHYRIAVKDKKTGLGLPEVMLGLLPGAGGTQRLPQLIGVPNALDMTLTGKTIPSDRAKRMGLVDVVVPPLGPGIDTPENRTRQYLEEVSVNIAKQLASGKLKVDRKKKNFFDTALNFALTFNWVRDQIFGRAKKQVMKLSGGLYPAPLKILEVIRTGVERGPHAGYIAESKAFGELAMTPQSKGLIGLFRGQTECKKNRFGVPKQRVKYVHFVGAGLMGAGIAHVSVDKGYNVIMKDANQAGLDRGLGQIQEGLEKGVKRKKFSSKLYFE